MGAWRCSARQQRALRQNAAEIDGRYGSRRASGSQRARRQAAAECRSRQLQSRNQGRGRLRRRQGEPRRLPRDAGQVARAAAQARRRPARREVVRPDVEEAARQAAGRRRCGSRRHHSQRHRGVRPDAHLGDQAVPQGVGWRDTEAIVFGGGFRSSRIGELAVGRTEVLLKSDDYKIELELIQQPSRRGRPDRRGAPDAVMDAAGPRRHPRRRHRRHEHPRRHRRDAS